VLKSERVRHEAELAELRFAGDYPELRGQYGSLAQKANEALVEQIGDVSDLPPQAYIKLVNREFVRLAKEAGEGNKPKQEEPVKAPIADTAKKPKAAKIITNKNGTKSDTPKSSVEIGEDLIANISKNMFGG